MYEYIEGFHDLVNWVKEHHPRFERDKHGNLIDPNKINIRTSEDQMMQS